MRGHLKQRSKGSRTIVLDLGRDPATGKHRQQWQTVRGTKKEAEKKLAEVQHALDTGSFIQPSKLTVRDFLQQWMRDYVSSSVRAATAEGYRIIVECHLIPKLGGVVLSELRPSHLQAYYAKALKEGRRDGRGGLAGRTVAHHHTVLKEALSHAVKWELITRNVGDAVDPPRAIEPEMNALDPEGAQALLDAARGTIYFPLIHLATFTGMRRSELLGLRWGSINFSNSTVAISQILHCLPVGRIVGGQRNQMDSLQLLPFKVFRHGGLQICFEEHPLYNQSLAWSSCREELDVRRKIAILDPTCVHLGSLCSKTGQRSSR